MARSATGGIVGFVAYVMTHIMLIAIAVASDRIHLVALLFGGLGGPRGWSSRGRHGGSGGWSGGGWGGSVAADSAVAVDSAVAGGGFGGGGASGGW